MNEQPTRQKTLTRGQLASLNSRDRAAYMGVLPKYLRGSEWNPSKKRRRHA